MTTYSTENHLESNETLLATESKQGIWPSPMNASTDVPAGQTRSRRVQNDQEEICSKNNLTSAKFKLAEYKLRIALLVAFVVVLAAAAVLAALYAPAHMPSAIANIVNSLSGVAHNAILGTAYGVGGAALLSMFYMGKKGSQGGPDFMPQRNNDLVSQQPGG